MNATTFRNALPSVEITVSRWHWRKTLRQVTKMIWYASTST